MKVNLFLAVVLLGSGIAATVTGDHLAALIFLGLCAALSCLLLWRANEPPAGSPHTAPVERAVQDAAEETLKKGYDPQGASPTYNEWMEEHRRTYPNCKWCALEEEDD